MKVRQNSLVRRVRAFCVLYLTLGLPCVVLSQETPPSSSPAIGLRISDEPAPASPPSAPPIVQPAPLPTDAAPPAPELDRKTVGETVNEAVEDVIDEIASAESSLDIYFEQSQPFSSYRTHQTGFQWIPGSNDDLGWFSWQSDPYLSRASDAGLSLTFNLHGLSGPVTPDVSPRLYDAVAAYQVRRTISDRFSYDVSASVGVFSDFEGSARKGVRFPAHAVGMMHINHRADLVFGIDYLDREDIKVLPVAGVSIREFIVPNMRLDLVFPRPRLDFVVDDQHRVYFAALLGGGTWDFEATANTRELLTYRDYRLLFGFEFADDENHLSAIEFGYAFSREIEFANAGTSHTFPDAFVLQWVSRY
ncbi:MAG: hypothetical protein JNL67_17355 [Planctomycetaceae bacterium]|nr:hypothetical protein [Planctomycetaceae bacterium]